MMDVMLFFVAVLRNCCVRVIIRISVIFVFLCSCVLREYAFLTKVSTLTANFFYCFVGEYTDFVAGLFVVV